MFDYCIIIIAIILASIGFIVCNSKDSEEVGVSIIGIAMLFWLIGGLICEASKPLKLDR